MADQLDLIELLQADHLNLRESEGHPEVEEAVAKHLTVERELFYPLVSRRSICSDEELDELRTLDRSLADAVVKARTDPSSQAALNQAIETHISVQEALFSIVRDQVDEATLLRIAEDLPLTMAEAPTHVHPHLPAHALLEGAAEDIAEAVDTFEDRFGRKDQPRKSEG